MKTQQKPSPQELEDYRLYVAESRACGYEYLDFDEWSGRVTWRQKFAQQTTPYWDDERDYGFDHECQ